MQKALSTYKIIYLKAFIMYLHVAILIYLHTRKHMFSQKDLYVDCLKAPYLLSGNINFRIVQLGNITFQIYNGPFAYYFLIRTIINVTLQATIFNPSIFIIFKNCSLISSICYLMKYIFLGNIPFEKLFRAV